MESARGKRVRGLRALPDISWLRSDQLDSLAGALIVTGHEMRSTIFSEKSTPESAYILLSGVARITCVNRKGRRTTAIILSPGLIPAFPAAVDGITYNFRCEAITSCQVGTVGLNSFTKISLGIGSAAFKRMAASFLGRWDRVHLRCSNLMRCTLEERLALVLLDLSQNFGVPDHGGGMRLTVPVRHYDLAELVGATRPRVSEHLRDFAKRHLVYLQNERWVIDPDGLKGFLMEARREELSEELS